MSATTTHRPDGQRPTIVCHLVLASLLAITAVAYVQRNCISPAEKTVRDELGLRITATAAAQSAFFFSYALLQVPSGWLAQRLGPRLALPLYATGWSLTLLLLAVATGALGLIGSRLAMGALQAGIFPCATLVLMAWYPASLRGVSSALLNSFMLIGGAVGSLITGLLLEPVGWRALFALYTAPGVAWAVFFVLWFRNRPQEHPGVNAAELARITGMRLSPPPEAPTPGAFPAEPSEKVVAHRDALAEAAQAQVPPAEEVAANRDALAEQPAPAVPALAPPPLDPDLSKKLTHPERGPVPWRAILFSLPLFLLCAQQFCRAGANRLYDNWLPTYLQEARGVSKEAAGVLASLPQWAGVVGGLLGGIVSDLILYRTRSRRAARNGLAIASLIGSILISFAAYPIPHPFLATLVLSVAAFVFTFSSPCSYALSMDLSGRNVAVVFGFMNMAGNFGAFAFVFFFGWLKDRTGNYTVSLSLFVAFQLVALVCWLFLRPEGTIGEPEAPRE